MPDADAVILGTGVTECVLSALLSVEGKKVLHIDRNDYYGAECASLTLTQLYNKFRPGEEVPKDIGRDRDYAIDMIPKFMMANGEIVNMLVHTDVTRYLEFKQIAASYVYRDKRIAKVPSTEMEAVRSPLMGLFEKRRAKRFFEFLQNWRDNDPKTHQGVDLDSWPMEKVFAQFGLEPGTRDFIGHAMALHLDDLYLQRPARETYERILLYMSSMARYGKSPYIYPLYGLGELPQGFARLSAIYGGTYMLDKPVDEIVLDESGKFAGVRSGDETVKAKMVVGDPSYFRSVGNKSRVRETEKVVRAICILKHPIPNTDNSDSVQLIIPQNQVGRKHGTFLSYSFRHLHCRSVLDAQRVPQGPLHRAGLDCRRDGQARTGAAPWSRPSRPDPRKVCHDHHARGAPGVGQGRQCLYHALLRSYFAFRNGCGGHPRRLAPHHRPAAGPEEARRIRRGPGPSVMSGLEASCNLT